jgi:hypothetical protein
MKPYPISYRSLIPKAAECENLFVPVCLAASHIAYGSIRMEPVFMIMGQSSATAAAMAIDDRVPVQKADYGRLRARLLADRQILAWTNTTPIRVSATIPRPQGIVIDDDAATATGDWIVSSSVPNAVGAGYRHDGNKDKGTAALTFTPKVPSAGRYEISLVYVPNENRARNVPVSVLLDGKTAAESRLNQRVGNGIALLGAWELRTDSKLVIRVGNEGTDGFVVVDGIEIKSTASGIRPKN